MRVTLASIVVQLVTKNVLPSHGHCSSLTRQEDHAATMLSESEHDNSWTFAPDIGESIAPSASSIWSPVTTEEAVFMGEGPRSKTAHVLRSKMNSLRRRRRQTTDALGLTMALNARGSDGPLQPIIRHEQQRNRLSKRWTPQDGRNHRESVLRHYNALLKDTLDLQKRAVNTLAPAMPYTVPIDEDGHDMSYFCTIGLGSQALAFRVVVDSGSGDLWVPSSECTSAACQHHATFGPRDSRTFTASRVPWKVHYGSGTVSGFIVQDVVTINGITTPAPILFGTADTLAATFANFPSDGILGLGNSSSTSENIPTFIDNLVSLGMIPRKLVSVNLQRAKDSNTDNGRSGQLSFGIVDTSKFYGRMVTTPNISSTGLWEAKIDGIFVGGQQLNFGQVTGIIDTGTTLLLAPPTAAMSIHAIIPGAQSDGRGTFAIPCATMIDISLSFAGTQFFIDPRDYIGGPVSPGSGMCISNISGQQIGRPNQFLIGDVFLKNVYTSFDYDAQLIGFGAKGPFIGVG